jgi:hypothetical protein
MSEELNNKIKEADPVEEAVVEETKVEESAPVVEEAVVEEEVEKPKITEAAPVASDVISAPKPGPATKPGLGFVGNGAMGSTVVPKNNPKKTAKPAAKEVEKVAIHSTKNVTWSEVGKVYRGYNIVTKEQADRWLTRDHIRLATPEEVAKEFNN